MGSESVFGGCFCIPSSKGPSAFHVKLQINFGVSCIVSVNFIEGLL